MESLLTIEPLLYHALSLHQSRLRGTWVKDGPHVVESSCIQGSDQV
jgi:hypothetical protein